MNMHKNARLTPLGLRLVGVEIVKNDMDLPLRLLGDNAFHEIEELDAPVAPLIRR